MAAHVGSDGKVKLLDTARPNTIPKFYTDGSERYDRSKPDPGLPTAMQIRTMLNASQKGTEDDPLGERPDMIARLEAARQTQLAERREREKDLFQLDKEPLDTFALPGKPESSVMLPAQKKKIQKKMKLKVTEISQEDPGPSLEKEAEAAIPVNEFDFLSTATGYKRMDGDEERKEAYTATGGAIQRPGTTPAVGGGQTADLDEASIILGGLQTGDDAINFFARFGSETGVKFVHLKEVKDSKVYAPYDLVRVETPVPVGEEYYTMSPAGIVWHCPGENSECIPLSAWMRHGMLFKILRNIGFYKYFLHRKIFNTWRDNVRFLLFAKQRKSVGSRLYMTRKTTINAILCIKKHLMNVQSVRLLYVDGRTLEKDVFVEQQTQNCIKSGTLFEEAMRNVTNEVQTVIHQIQNMHSKASVDPNNQAVAYNDDVPEKHKSLLRLRQEKVERIAMRKQAKLEYATLPAFIRFIDYLTVEALVSIAITTLQSFYDDFTKHRKNGVFETMVRFNASGSYFSPTCGELQSVMDRLIEIMVNSVGNLNRVAYLNNKSQSSGASIQSIVRNDRKFCETIHSIKSRLEQDFERAEEHAHSYDSVRPIYDFNATWDFAAFKAEQHDMNTYKSMMQMINDWNKELEKLRNRPIGVLEIDSKRLKNELNPLREARLTEIKSFIMENARAKCLALTETYKDHLAKLANKPSQLKDFAGQCAIVQAMRDEEKALFKQTFSVDQMYALLQQSDDLHDKQQMYRQEMEVAVAYKDAKVNEMISNVETNIVKLEDQITGVVARLDDNDFSLSTRFGEAHVIVEELDSMQAKLESFDQVAATYTGYQNLFGATEYQFENLEKGRERCEVIKSTWSSIANFNAKYKAWTEDQFTNADVADLKAIMPAIMDLGNPNMRSRHWEKVFKLVGKEYVEGMDFDLKMLLNGKIMDFKDQIGEISGTASGESQLEMSLEKIVKAWENQNFIVLNHRDQHNLFILGSLEEIFTLLEDNQLANFSETLDEWLVCQKTWMYLENIFGAEDIQKQLPAESQKFLEGAEITLLDQFNMNNAALDSIQKSLEEYLETKRMAFPRIKFGEGAKKKADILGFFDPGGEYVELSEECKHAYTKYPATDEGAIDRKDWLWSYPAQVVIAIDQTMWTWNGEAALKKITMKDFLDFSLKQIDAMVDLVRMPLDKQQRTLLGALLTIDVHARDVTRALHKQNVGSRSDFMWTKQLRYEWDEKLDDVVAKQTIACALHMRLGGAPAGPAGTDGLDYKIMGRFFSGLAQQGAWSCFDEFNRIDIEVLSVIAQQILCIQQAISRSLKEFDFEGRMIPLNYSFELPDNLKSLFRPVAMMVPDYRLIAEIMLFSEGFANALPLSNKMSQLYALASEQLSKQSHYDFGMRAVKTVLVAAETLIGILKDLFPGVQVPYKVPSFISKVIQVHETQLVRHGMMIVGESGSGKSCNHKILAEALSMLKEEVDRLILNPKSIHAGELYGEFNLATNEWRDGIVPKLWVIFDGPMLCLANSERIKLPNTMHMLFEVQDLKVASPATVSRCGMVYMEQVHVGMLSLVRTWASTTLKELTGLPHLEACMDFIRYECKEKVSTSNNQVTAELVNLVASMLMRENEGAAEDNDLMTALVVWSITWSVGANIVDADRPKFDNFCRNRFQSVLQTKFVALVKDGVYEHLLPDFRYDPAVPYFNILVPTVETTKYRYVLERLMSAGNNVLFMAETGVAKGTTVSYSMDVLESKLEKKRKTLLGPPSGKKMFLFIDDLNMPALETYGFYDVSPRFIKAMHTIFTSIVRGYMNINVDIYMRIQKELLPTPSKSHYTFNLRDLSKVFQGLLMVHPKHLETKEKIIRLWAHEASRVFRDRLINDEDRKWFNDANFADIIFGDFMTKENKEYQELEDREKVNAVLNEYLEEYNLTFPSRMDLVFFRDAINHISRVARVLSQPRGNALLVGVGGSGRQSLARMASFMADFKCRQIEITRGYGMNEWHENLREILMNAGAKNQPTVFLFSDTQIVNETFLEDLNNILNSGEVPNLYAQDELEKIMVSCTNFRTHALYSVAHRLFESQTQLGIGPYVESLSTMCNKMHRTVEVETANFFQEVKRYNYTTPTSYLELIKLYRRYRVGLDKLKETEEVVAKLEEELTLMKPVLEKASIDTEALLTLDKKSIQEMKSFANPPEMVKFTLEADSWGEGKKVLNNSDFLDQCKNYDKDNIKKKVMKSIMPYYKDERFQPELVKAQSSAAMCLCAWVRIEPKKAALKSAEDSLAVTMAELKKQLKETQDKKAELEAQANKAKVQLVRAGQLLALTNLVGDMCLAAACMAYLGPFTSQFRARIVSSWIASSEPVVVRGWQIDGLPADDFSCENGLLTTMGRRWPLMIDPQGQANRWVRNMYANSNLQIIKLTEKEFLRTLENGIRYGAPVLLENKAGQMLLRLGDTDVPYSDEFKFMITTKLANPHYMPEICIKNERPDLEERKDQLVVMLANASGNILDDEELIDALALSKKTSTAINARLQEAETTTLEINTTREGYRSVATRGSFYKALVNTRLQKTEKKEVLQERLDLLIADITESIYLNVCRGLFEKDKLVFAFIIAANIDRQKKIVTEEEFLMFMVGPIPDAGFTGIEIDSKNWQNAVIAWAQFLTTDTPDSDTLPGDWEGRLNKKITSAIRRYVGENIGAFFCASPPFDLEGSYNDSTCTTPLIFILSPGADPTDYLVNLAEAKGKSGERAVDSAQKMGDWVCLQNCHLATMQNDPSAPPRGIKANLQRTFADISSDDYESCSKGRVYKKLAFATAFFNALILERRKFGAVGWNIAYEWMLSDLKAAMRQVKMYVEESTDGIPWETLNVSVCAVTYGGRVTDMWDKRTVAREYYAPAEGTDKPDVFGLHPNAAITFQQKESKALLNTVVTCADSKVAEIAVRISDRMPKQYDLRKAHPDSFKRGGEDNAVNSLGVFLGQELLRFNGLIAVMAQSLHQLQRAIKGEVVMDGVLENMYQCFIFQKVPPAWENAGYPCLKPLPSWVEDFLGRIDFMGRWLYEGPRPAYWLPGFFFPQGFMTAHHDITEPPEIGAYIYGIFMEALLDDLPSILLLPVISEEYHPENVYNCPLYKTSLRAGTLSTTGHSTNFVVTMTVPSMKEEDHWVRRGCAMLCMRDD
eukprot:GSChrysophyteH1.ASY1.ANO1.950.1 assembled CDS